MADGKDYNWSHILVETTSLDDVKGVLRGSSRLRFTFLDVSSKHIALGTNTGSIYIFGRTGQKHPQIIVPEVDPAQVNCISISPTDRSLAFSTIKGHVLVYEIPDKRQRPEKLRFIGDHVQSTVTSLTWETTGSKLYTADSTGRIYVTSVPISKVQNLVSLPPEVILRLESSICQLDFSEDKLLVSTLSKCYLCYTTRQKFTQIGSKPRDGEFGACFHRQPSSGLYKIYCARPGSRIWEVDIEGNVLNTHMFKQMLAVPQLPCVSSVDYSWPSPEDKQTEPKSLSFPRLKTTRGNFLYTWVKQILYVFDPVNVKVVFWTDLGSEIQNIVSSDNYLFIFYLNGNIQKTKIFPIPQCLSFLISKKSWALAAKIFDYFHTKVERSKWKKFVTVTDFAQLKEHNRNAGNLEIQNDIDELVDSFPNLIDAISDLEDSSSDRSRSSSNASVQKLELPKISSETSILSPEVRAIPEDLVSSFHDIGSPALKTQKSKIIDLIDTISDSTKSKSHSLGVYESIEKTGNSFAGERNDGEATCSVEHSNNGNRNDMPNLELRNEDLAITPTSNHIDTQNTTEDTAHEKVVSTCPEIRTGRNVGNDNLGNTETNVNGFILDTDINQIPKKEPSFVIEEDLQPVISLEQDEVAPLVIPQTSGGRKKKKSRKQSVNDITFGEGTTIKKGMRRSKSMGSLSKSMEKKLFTRQSFEETVEEETIDGSKGGLDLVAETKSLGEESFESSSPSGSLAQSWESTGSEKFTGLKKMSISKLDSVQSKITNTKNKLLNVIKNKARPSREGRSTPDTVSLDSVDGIIISTEKVQKDIQEVTLVVQGPIDLTDLQKSTERTQKLLQDFNVLMNPTELQKTLSDWIKELNQSLCRLHTFIYVERLRKFHTCGDGNGPEIDDNNVSGSNFGDRNSNNSGLANSKSDTSLANSNKTSSESNLLNSGKVHTKHLENLIDCDNLDFSTICHINDPFLMGKELCHQVSELTQMCFDCGCHGDLADFVYPSNGELENLVICDKCKEVLNVDKFSKKCNIYNFHQRDSGFNENCDKSSKSSFSEKREHLINADANGAITEKQNISSACDNEDCSNFKENDHNYENCQNDSAKSKNDQNAEQMLKENENEDNILNDNCAENDDSGHFDNEKISPNGETDTETEQNLGESNLNDDVSTEHVHNSYQSSSSSINMNETQKTSDDKSVYQAEFKASTFTENKNLKSKEQSISNDCSCCYCHQSHVVCFHGDSARGNNPEMMNFVQYYFPLLNIDAVKTKAYSRGEKSFDVWCGMVRCLQEHCKKDSIYTKIKEELSTTTELMRLGEFQQSKVLAYVSRLFEVNADKALQVCEGDNTICPRDVLYFCQWYSLSKEKNFYKFMISKLDSSEGHNYYKDSYVTKLWLEILLKQTDNIEQMVDKDGNPRPWSHLLPWKDQALIDDVISVVPEDHLQHFTHLCQKLGYWSGYLVLLKIQKRNRDTLKTILYLQDLQLLTRNSELFPTTFEDWKWLIEEFSQISQNDINTEDQPNPAKHNHDHDSTKSCDQVVNKASWDRQSDQLVPDHAPITWDALGQLMLQMLGPVMAVQTIQDCGMTDVMFSPEFFQCCVLSSYLHRQQRNVTHSMLEKLDSYLWTKKPNTLMPELQFMVNSEREGKKDVKEAAADSRLYLTSDQALVSRQYKEEPECHWGTSTRISRNCRNCNIKLTETISHVEPGIIIFPCGHGFHKFCCPLRECILCLDLE